VGYFAGTAPSAYHPLHIRHQLEQTLDNLGTNYLDIYFFHNFHFGIGDEYLEAAIEQMRALRSEGLIRAIGMRGPHRFATDRLTISSGRRSDKHERFLEMYTRIRPDFLAVRYNMLTEDDTLFEWALQRDVTVFVNKPLSQGLLTGKYDALRPRRFGAGDHRSRKRWFTPAALAVIAEGLKPIRQRFGCRPDDLVRVALRYCMRADNAVVIVGFTTPAHVEMNFKSLGKPLSKEDFAFLQDALTDLRRELAALGDVFLDEL
jgi:aryl-alcohol dehydrogenase-like predicted oxidoreductase